MGVNVVAKAPPPQPSPTRGEGAGSEGRGAFWDSIALLTNGRNTPA